MIRTKQQAVANTIDLSLSVRSSKKLEKAFAAACRNLEHIATTYLATINR